MIKGIVDPKIENLLLFTLEKNGLNKIDVFFPGIEASVIRFSLRCKENELHRKYKVLGATVYGKPYGSPNFRDRTKWMVPLDLARLRV